jgi:hypothetical protein
LAIYHAKKLEEVGADARIVRRLCMPRQGSQHRSAWVGPQIKHEWKAARLNHEPARLMQTQPRKNPWVAAGDAADNAGQ